MEVGIGVVMYILMGVIIAELARLIGSKIFKISNIYTTLVGFLKKRHK